MFKQMGCVTSIYDKRRDASKGNSSASSSSFSSSIMECDLDNKSNQLKFRSLIRNEEKIDKSFPGIIELMQV
jgi:hypothetical protein